MSGLDLYLSQRTLALLFVCAALTGVGLGLVYDGLRILRMLFGEAYARPGETPAVACPSGKGRGYRLFSAGLRFLCDLLFMLTAFIALILLCYYANDGQLRAPAPVGMVCGFFVYRHTVSPWALRLAAWILRQIRRGITAVTRLLAIPLRWLWRVTLRRLMVAIARSRREKQTRRRIDELTEAAARGFDLLAEGRSERE